MSFADLGVASETIRSLRARGITTPTRIQSLAIPPGLGGQDVCGRAPTGSGKTIAFGIPLVARVGPARPGRPARLMLAPTRELAAQIRERDRPAARFGTAPEVAAFYGGVGFGGQLRPCGAVSTWRWPAPAAWPTWSTEEAYPGGRRPWWWSTKPTAWPTWASCPRCGSSRPGAAGPANHAVFGHPGRRRGRPRSSVISDPRAVRVDGPTMSHPRPRLWRVGSRGRTGSA